MASFPDVVIKGIASKIFQYGANGPKMIVLDENNIEFVNAQETALINIHAASLLNCIRSITYPIGLNPSYSSVDSIPANSVVFFVFLFIIAAYDPGVTISIGNTTDASLVMGIGDNTPQVPVPQVKLQITPWGGLSLPVKTTINGVPTMGSGAIVALYSEVPGN